MSDEIVALQTELAETKQLLKGARKIIAAMTELFENLRKARAHYHADAIEVRKDRDEILEVARIQRHAIFNLRVAFKNIDDPTSREDARRVLAQFDGLYEEEERALQSSLPTFQN